MEHFLIVGLGNPGSTYDNTRHNIGFDVVRKFAEKHGLSWKKDTSLEAEIASGVVGEKKILLLLPLTYMNVSGRAVRKALDYYKIDPYRMCVVVDDVETPLGGARLKEKGSSGGHNGLKSIESYLNSQYYLRLRIGIGKNTSHDLSDFVLGKFSLEERKLLDQTVLKAVEVLETWMLEGFIKAQQKTSKKWAEIEKLGE